MMKDPIPEAENLLSSIEHSAEGSAERKLECVKNAFTIDTLKETAEHFIPWEHPETYSPMSYLGILRYSPLLSQVGLGETRNTTIFKRHKVTSNKLPFILT